MDDNLDSSNQAQNIAPISFSDDGDRETRAESLRSQAARCRRLCSSVLDPRTRESLTGMAEEYEAEAARLDAGE
ncbi:hypothetical protein P1X14_01970 [Sphingomonas sp. AOB5]|uniref:hypothetical protein n=1 Tax=Sphingomonas sp. AOB5 TaxID=3034017 RepID=UPI0023F93C25|nr:hypothetical protein [Sphingomonas sp. AOB5]MDF7774000.1 hypothetical protein [Sphingomonas sp. AOB5]